MSYLGNQSTQIRSSSQVQVLDGDGSTTAFTLSHRVNTASDLEVFVNNVQQQPTVAYTASETTLTFTEAPSSATGNIYIIFRGFAIQQVQAFTGIDNIVADTTPQLGGNLDVNGNDIVSTSNANIDILPNGTGKVILDGNGSTGGVSISDGLMEMRSGTGSPAQIDFYCETNNQHKVSLKSPAHTDYSGNVVSTLPTATGTLVNQVASNGIYFGVSSATASNLLDDFEEGTFTHGLSNFSTAISSGWTIGRFVKIGHTVWVHGVIVANSGNVTGTVAITGLPFTVIAGSQGYSVGMINGNIATTTFGSSNHNPVQRIDPNQTYIQTGVTSGSGGVNLVYSGFYTTS